MKYGNRYRETMETITEECRLTLSKVNPESVDEFVNVLLAAEKVFFIGVGRVMLLFLFSLYILHTLILFLLVLILLLCIFYLKHLLYQI